MLVLGTGSVLTVAPNTGLIIWPLVAMAFLACGVVTATKGRSGWLLAGFVTAGILWVPGARQAALPGVFG
jgi:hypothetical protein